MINDRGICVQFSSLVKTCVRDSLFIKENNVCYSAYIAAEASSVNIYISHLVNQVFNFPDKVNLVLHKEKTFFSFNHNL